MTIDDQIKMKNSNIIVTEKRQKYQPDHQVKLINLNILQVKKYHLLITDQGEKQVKSIQNQGQVKASKKYTSNDKDERLEEITALDKNINLDNLI